MFGYQFCNRIPHSTMPIVLLQSDQVWIEKLGCQGSVHFLLMHVYYTCKSNEVLTDLMYINKSSLPLLKFEIFQKLLHILDTYRPYRIWNE